MLSSAVHSLFQSVSKGKPASPGKPEPPSSKPDSSTVPESLDAETKAPPSKPALTTRAIFLLDQSASMGPAMKGGYSAELRLKFDDLTRELTGEIETHCIVFATTATGGATFASLPILNTGTKIENALREVTANLTAAPCDRVILVFISDGADDERDTIMERIAALPPFPVTACHIVTVAVGGSFPTGMALRLRDHFQTDASTEADSRPFVIEMRESLASAALAVRRVGLFIEDVLRPRKVRSRFDC